MKFGKLFKEKQEGGWAFVDYKRLKGLLKDKPSSFAAELWAEIAVVNAAFLEEERRLMSQLSVHTAGERDSSHFFDEVRQLYRSIVLNYIAILKIVKKHDKLPDVSPLRPPLLEHLFVQAFVTSLEHSYLFEECWRVLQSDPSCSGSIEPGLAEQLRSDFDTMRRLTPANVTELEIERMLGADPETAQQYYPKTQRPAGMPPSPPIGSVSGPPTSPGWAMLPDSAQSSGNVRISVASPARLSRSGLTRLSMHKSVRRRRAPRPPHAQAPRVVSAAHTLLGPCSCVWPLGGGWDDGGGLPRQPGRDRRQPAARRGRAAQPTRAAACVADDVRPLEVRRR